MKTFKHLGGGGDMLYGLATMQELGGGILIQNGHPFGFFHDLLVLQPYITEIKYVSVLYSEWQKIKVDYNLDLFREQNFSEYTIVECHARAFNLKFDFTKPWLFNIEPNYVADIVINDTGLLRWPGITIDWNLLKPYKDRCVFIGLDIEYDNFQKDTFKLKRHHIKTALEFAQVIAGSKIYVGNQSTGLAISEGMKVNRFADLYMGWSKQYPYGENGHYEITNELIEKYLSD